MYHTITRIVARVSGMSFVGPSLNRNEEWISISVNYTRNLFQGAAKLRTWSLILRPLVKYFVPEIRRVWGYNRKAINLLAPIIQQKVKDREQEGYQKPFDSLEWFRDALPDTKMNDIREISLLSLALGAVSIHTTSQMITNVIFDLAARPELIDILRDELYQTLENSDGNWNQDFVRKLRKMDSVMKESQRINPPLVGEFNVSLRAMVLHA